MMRTYELLRPGYATPGMSNYVSGIYDDSQDRQVRLGYEQLAFQKDQAAQQNALRQQLFGKINSFSTWTPNSRPVSFSSVGGFRPPAPKYLSASPIWSQGQIDAQANLQRANLQTQAADSGKRVGEDLVNRGFSPVASPFLNFAQQNALMKANAAAAANETGLNWTAAQANKSAELETGKINAALYGDWLQALLGGYQTQTTAQARQQELAMQQQMQQQQLQQQYQLGLLNSLRGLV